MAAPVFAYDQPPPTARTISTSSPSDKCVSPYSPRRTISMLSATAMPLTSSDMDSRRAAIVAPASSSLSSPFTRTCKNSSPQATTGNIPSKKAAPRFGSGQKHSNSLARFPSLELPSAGSKGCPLFQALSTSTPSRNFLPRAYTDAPRVATPKHKPACAIHPVFG